jgi:hypothetical protein
MNKEYDLTNELGPQNWLDMVAGEAVIWGHCLNDPMLVAMGTELSLLVQKIRFDDDKFALAEAKGRALERKLAEKKEAKKTTVFIDEMCMGKEGNKSLYDWEFDLVFTDGKYQIQMILPVYYDREKFNEEVRTVAEVQIQASFSDPSFENYEKESVSTVYESQIFVNTRYYDEQGKLLKRTVDFNHEGSSARGWNDFYYFDDFKMAFGTWEEMKKAILSRTK